VSIAPCLRWCMRREGWGGGAPQPAKAQEQAGRPPAAQRRQRRRRAPRAPAAQRRQPRPLLVGLGLARLGRLAPPRRRGILDRHQRRIAAVDARQHLGHNGSGPLAWPVCPSPSLSVCLSVWLACPPLSLSVCLPGACAPCPSLCCVLAVESLPGVDSLLASHPKQQQLLGTSTRGRPAPACLPTCAIQWQSTAHESGDTAAQPWNGSHVRWDALLHQARALAAAEEGDLLARVRLDEWRDHPPHRPENQRRCRRHPSIRTPHTSPSVGVQMRHRMPNCRTETNCILLLFSACGRGTPRLSSDWPPSFSKKLPLQRSVCLPPPPKKHTHRVSTPSRSPQFCAHR
jgi:hypothetical protein